MEKTRIGKIMNTHGVRGEMKVAPLTAAPSRYDVLEHVFIEDSKKRYTEYEVEGVRYHKEHVQIKLKGIEDMDAAKLHKNHY